MRTHLITTSRRRAVLALVALLLSSVSISAQTNSSTDKSTPSYLTPGAPAGSYALSSFDNVNLLNGNLNFHLPLIGLEGRGGANMRSMLNIEQRWRVDHYFNEFDRTYLNSANYNWWTGIKPGYGAAVLVGRTAVLRTSECMDGSGNYRTSAGTIVTRLTFTMADGTEYELHDQLYDGQPLDQPPTCSQWGHSRGNVFIGWDGSATTFVSDTNIHDNLWSLGEGYTLFYPSGVLLLKDGTRYRIDNGLVSWMRDRNGNKISFTYDTQYKRVTSITDSLNRQITITYNVDDGAPYGLCDKLTFRGFGNAPRTLRVSRRKLIEALRPGYSIGTEAQLFPELNGNCSNCNVNPDVTSAVWLPDGRAYEFLYNNYAELARVVLPTGGAYEYDYAAGLSNTAASGVFPSYSNSDDPQIYRRVVEKRIYSNGNTLTGKMTFSRPESMNAAGSPESIGFVKQDSRSAGGALLARSKHYFHGYAMDNVDVLTGFSPWLKGKEYKTEHLAANGTTVLRREEQTWQQRANVWWWAGWAAKVAPPAFTNQDYAPGQDTRLVTTLTTLEPNGPNLVKKQTALNPANGNAGFDQYHNQTDSWEYDYGVGAPPSHAVRHTHTDFVYVNPANNSIDYAAHTGAHIRNLSAAQQVYAVDPANGVETLAAHSTTSYDEGGYPLLPYAAVVGWADPGTTARGNATSSSRWLNTTGGWLTTHAQYDQTGNLRRTWNAREHLSETFYGDSFADGNNSRNTYAFPTATSSAVPDPSGSRGSSISLTTATTYDYWTGHVTSATDANTKTTTVQYNDALDRVTLIARPDGGQTTFDYIDTNPCGPYIQTRTRLDTAGRQTDSYQFFDGLGRAVRTFQYDGQDAAKPFLTSDIGYDDLGRTWRMSNPYRSAGCASPVNPSGYWTTTKFDGLSRATEVTTPDGASVITNYDGNATTVTDQTGKQRTSVTDARGLLTSVTEDPGGLNYQTTYRYDALGNLRKATQDTQHRFFLYDSLGRLIRAKNPEQQVNGNLTLPDSVTGNTTWSLAYAYDNNGNISTRTDARGITTTYTYDALNRTTLVDYSNTTTNPDIDRRYDNPNNNGRGYYWNDYFYNDDGRTNHQAIDAYDAMGRPKAKRQVFQFNGQWHTYGMGRTYDLAGHPLTDTYASGNVVNYNYDLAGRLGDNGSSLALTGNLGNGITRTYATAFEYDAANRLQQEKFGMTTALYHKLHYNLRGQLYDTRLSTVSFTTDKWNWNRGALVNYYSTAELTAPNNIARSLSGPNNNGNLLRSATYVPLDPNGGYTEGNNSTYAYTQDDYSYDTLNRLSSMSEASGTQAGLGWYTLAQVYKYDRWGNRTLDLDANCSASQMGTRHFVANIYQVTLSRGADFDGWRAWNKYLREGYALGAAEMLARAKTTVAGFFHSLEYINRGRTNREYVRDLYLAYLNREPDQGGWDAWTNVAATQGREVVLNGFANSQEFANSAANLCPSGMTFGGVNTAAYNVNESSNQLTPVGAGTMTYDQAGNLIYDKYSPLTTWGTRSYDAENRMIQQDNTTGQLISKYNYDADGHRVRRHIGGTEAWQVYGFDGQLWAEYAAGAGISAPQKEYGYRNGELLVVAESGQTASQPGGAPYAATPSALPGVIEAEHFNGGGQGTAYHDTTPGSHGQDYDVSGYPPPAFRQPTDVDIYRSSSAYSNGYLIMMQAGDWMNYTADIAATGTYTLEARVAWGGVPGGTFHVEVDGVDKTGPVQIPDTGWTMQLITKTGVQLSAGRHVLRVVADTNAANGYTGDLDYIRLTPTSSPLAGYWKFDEAGGTVTADASGSGHTATLSGAAWSAGQFNGAVSFDGVNDYVGMGAPAGLVATGAVTMSAWVYPTGAGSDPLYGGVIVSKEGEYELARFADGSIGWALANSQPGWSWVNTGYVAPLNQWTHVAVVYDGAASVKTYANNVLVHTHAATGAIGDALPGQNEFRVGGRQAVGQYFQGRLDEVRVYRSALGAGEVAELAVAPASSTTASIQWLVSDHLGTPRMIADLSGSLSGIRRHDYLPFGEELTWQSGRSAAQGYIGDTVRQKFTGYEHDNETGLDYAQARYYASFQGRFTSVDPVIMSADRRFNPQEINLYTYCANNPLTHTDPDGRYFVGDNNRRVNVTVRNGHISVGKNASADLRRMATLINKSGSATAVSEFMKVANNVTKTHFRIETKPVNKNLVGYHQPHDSKGRALEWDDTGSKDTHKFSGSPAYIKDKSGNMVYKEATITIFEGNVNSGELETQRRTHADPDLTRDERLVAINAHEDVHNTHQPGIDKIRERHAGKKNDFNPEAASEAVETQVHREIKANRKKKNPYE